MAAHVALLRGINVGGKNRLSMKDLVSLLTGLGLRDVKTYIQSGNAVFSCADRMAGTLPRRISAAISRDHGFAPEVLVLSRKKLLAALARNPFPGAEREPATLHLFFLAGKPRKPDLASLEKVRAAGERYHLRGDVFYLHAPGGVGRSRLAARVEQSLGVAATARNWSTLGRILQMLPA